MEKFGPDGLRLKPQVKLSLMRTYTTGGALDEPTDWSMHIGCLEERMRSVEKKSICVLSDSESTNGSE